MNTRLRESMAANAGVQSWSPELLLVARLARISPSLADLELARVLASGSLDWDRVLRLTHHHGVAALVHAAWPRLGRVAEHTNFFARLRQTRLSQLHSDLEKYRSWLQLCAAFERRGIAAMTLKGFHAALSIYGQVGDRTVGDLDFLVRPNDVPLALDLLEDAGYLPFADWQTARRNVGLEYILDSATEMGLISERGIVVDLHWEAGSRGTMPPTDELFAGAMEFQVEGQRVLTAAPDAAMTILVSHGHFSSWSRLRWLVDVAEGIDKQSAAEYEQTESRLAAIGMQQALASALCHIESLWGRLPAPCSASARFRHVPRQSIVRYQRAVMERERAWAGMFDRWRPLRMLWDRLRSAPSFVAAVASAARPSYFDWARVALPRPFRLGYYFVRAVRVLTPALTRDRMQRKQVASLLAPPPAAAPPTPTAAEGVAPGRRRHRWTESESVPLTFVTAIYTNDPSTLIGGRGWDLSFYLPSLINIANLGAPIVVYCESKDARAIEQAIGKYFRD